MQLHVVSPAGASRRAAIGAATLIVAGAAVNQPAFAHPGGGQGTQGPSPHSALAPGHAQDPPGRRAHGNPSHTASSQGNRAEAVQGSPRAAKHAVKRHSSRGEGGDAGRSTPAATTQPSVPPQKW